MDILSRLGAAIDYIEENLTTEIDYNKIAKAAFCSPYNFHRMFSLVTGFSIMDYVRNRKLTLAALELQENDSKVIDIALKYGYESPVSFARAFRALHGISPSQARKRNTNLKAYPRLSFQIQIIGGIEMNYRIEEKPTFRAFGVEKEVDNNGSNMQIPDFFEECINNGTFGTIQNIGRDKYAFPNQPSMSGICGYRESVNDKFFYLIGWLVFNNEPLPDEFVQVTIPANKWAIFKTETYPDGPGDIEIIQGLWRRIYREWLPTSGYDIAEAPTIELDYYDNPEECHAEIWIPLANTANLKNEG